MVLPPGLEPGTYGLEVRRAIQLRHESSLCYPVAPQSPCFQLSYGSAEQLFSGVGGGTRTPTVFSAPSDFKSGASTNSATPTNHLCPLVDHHGPAGALDPRRHSIHFAHVGCGRDTGIIAGDGVLLALIEGAEQDVRGDAIALEVDTGHCFDLLVVGGPGRTRTCNITVMSGAL